MREQRHTLSRAVVEARAPGQVEADDAQTARYRALDFFPTPPWGARAVCEIIQRFEPVPLTQLHAHEPACGEGHIAEPLREYFGCVSAADINDYGKGYLTGDFLASDVRGGCDWIVTNPPFLKAAEFVRVGLQNARRGVAILARATFLESASRYEMLFASPECLTVYSPFCERIAMQLGSWDPKLSSATAYAWFIFVKSRIGFEFPHVIPVPPGTKARLTRADDARRFGARSETPLLGADT